MTCISWLLDDIEYALVEDPEPIFNRYYASNNAADYKVKNRQFNQLSKAEIKALVISLNDYQAKDNTDTDNFSLIDRMERKLFGTHYLEYIIKTK